MEAGCGRRATLLIQASPYTQEELTAKAHSYELEPCGSTVLCIDYVQNGIGSNSCGPTLSEGYRFAENRLTFTVHFALMKNE